MIQQLQKFSWGCFWGGSFTESPDEKYKGSKHSEKSKPGETKPRGNDRKEGCGETDYTFSRALDQNTELWISLCLFFCWGVISVWPAADHCISITSGSALQLLLQQSEPSTKISFRQISLHPFAFSRSPAQHWTTVCHRGLQINHSMLSTVTPPLNDLVKMQLCYGLKPSGPELGAELIYKGGNKASAQVTIEMTAGKQEGMQTCLHGSRRWEKCLPKGTDALQASL